MTPTDLEIPLSAGGRTSARHYAAPGETRARSVLVFAHGAGAGQDHPFMAAYARDLAGRGVDVVTFNFPYMEARRKVPDRAPVLEACFRDVIAEVRRVSSLVRHGLFIGGKSMGGRIATQVGADGLERLQGIVAFGYPLHPPGKPEQLRVSHLSRLRVPLLVVQGERDAFGTPPELSPHLATVPGGATIHVVNGGDHSLTVKGVAAEQGRAAVLAVLVPWMAQRSALP